jgi:hypothetical protein
MSDFGLHPRVVQNQPDQLPAEGRLGSSEIISKPRHSFFASRADPFGDFKIDLS